MLRKWGKRNIKGVLCQRPGTCTFQIHLADSDNTDDTVQNSQSIGYVAGLFRPSSFDALN